MEENKNIVNEAVNSDCKKDNQKVELYINHDNAHDEEGINLLNVFSNMKKRFLFFLPLMFILIILGLVVPVLMYETKAKNDNTIVVIGFEYEGSEEGLAPDKTILDVNYIKSSYIIQEALNSITLDNTPSISSIANNITVSGILTSDTQQQLEVIYALSESDDKYLQYLQEFELKYRAQYIVTLENGFKSGNSKVTLNSNDLEHLLNAITNAYSNYFIETYNDVKLVENRLESLNQDSYDYLDLLDEVKSYLTYLNNYCNEKYAVAPWFRASDGLSFNDLSNIIYTMSDIDIDYIYSYIYLNNISKDKESQLTIYNYEKRQAELDLAEINTNIASLEASIAAYKSDKVVIATTDGNQSTEAEVTSDYYNGLINKQIELNEEKSSLEKQISVLSDKITNLEGSTASAEQIAKAETHVEESLNNALSLYELVNNHTIELFNSSAYKNNYLTTIETTENGSTLMDNMKKIVIGVAIGVVLSISIWCVDALIIEIKRDKKAERKEETK